MEKDARSVWDSKSKSRARASSAIDGNGRGIWRTRRMGAGKQVQTGREVEGKPVQQTEPSESYSNVQNTLKLNTTSSSYGSVRDKEEKDNEGNKGIPFHHPVHMTSLNGEGEIIAMVTVDGGAMANLVDTQIYEATNALGPKRASERIFSTANRQREKSMGTVTVDVEMGGLEHQTDMEVFDSRGTFQVIIGKPGLEGMGAVQDYSKDIVIGKGKDGKEVRVPNCSRSKKQGRMRPVKVVQRTRQQEEAKGHKEAMAIQNEEEPQDSKSDKEGPDTENSSRDETEEGTNRDDEIETEGDRMVTSDDKQEYDDASESHSKVVRAVEKTNNRTSEGELQQEIDNLEAWIARDQREVVREVTELEQGELKRTDECLRKLL
ncbi:hypothetical protein FRB93_001985 [Tulasnella sp. JGI-2019a]|nr:hypothetical protein FRB93_001985 [Tulasnella sp. JGI-2019a]